ncbi:MAG: TetR/AcrR family transcriptional regulator [Candidatus Nanopelagicales bacterium]|jgi:AcrR family transcriptional regulator|nr:TetR/AcrR family transcriptional regulator [Candidatus Nanopelagicales bacterium]
MSAEDRRAQLVAIGLDLLQTRPIHELALDEVATAAGVSRTLVFHYFPSKGEYFAAVVATLGQRLLSDAPGDPAADVPTRLRAMVAGFLKFVRLHRGAYVTLVRGASGGEPLVLDILDEVRIALVELWLDAAEWPRRDELTRLAVRGWLGALEEVALTVAASGVPRAAAVDLLVEGLLDDLQRAARLAGEPMPEPAAAGA